MNLNYRCAQFGFLISPISLLFSESFVSKLFMYYHKVTGDGLGEEIAPNQANKCSSAVFQSARCCKQQIKNVTIQIPVIRTAGEGWLPGVEE